MKLNSILFSIIFLFMIDSVNSETLTRMRVDSVRFQEFDGSIRYDFPISIFRNRLYYETNDQGIRYTSYRIRTRVYQNDTLVGEELWDRVHCPDPNSTTSSGFLPDLARVNAENGRYRVEIELTDSVGRFRDRVSFPLIQFQQNTTEFMLSGLLLCSRIEPSTAESDEFHRNGYLVLPYAEKIYGTTQPILYLYWEQYRQLPDTTCQYEVQLFDRSNSLIYKSPLKTQKLNSDRGFHIEVIPVYSFPTGSYVVKVESQLIPSKRKQTSLSRFFVYTDSVASPSLPTSTLSSFELKQFPPIQKLYYLIDEDTRAFLMTLPSEEQYKWSENFWKEQESKASSPRYVRLNDYVKRLAYIQQFETGNKEGWQTDRGRVFLLYGPPDEIDDYAFQSSMTSEISSEFTGANKPYIIWKYHTLGGGVEFVFGDVRLFGDFTLMHSTMPGEIHDVFWWKKLKGIQ